MVASYHTRGMWGWGLERFARRKLPILLADRDATFSGGTSALTPHRVIMPSVVHDTRRYANDLAEVSHQPTRQREAYMRRFKSVAHAQRFLSVHGVIHNLFTSAGICSAPATGDFCGPGRLSPGTPSSTSDAVTELVAMRELRRHAR
jgi:hypothetical protein